MKAQRWLVTRQAKSSYMWRWPLFAVSAPVMLIGLVGVIAGGTAFLLIALAGFVGASPLLYSLATEGTAPSNEFVLIESLKRKIVLGAEIPELETMAEQVEQLEILLPKTDYNTELRHKINTEIEAHVQRVLRLITKPAGDLGLTLIQAQGQTDESLQWLQQICALVEKAVKVPQLPMVDDSDMLRELEKHAQAREEAIRELLQVTR